MNNTSQPCTIYLVRHGETEWNVKKLLQGHSDSPLTETGLQQAENLAKKLDGITFSAMYSSDLLRAKRTAEIIAMEKQMAVTATKILRERAFGALEGKDYQTYKSALQEQTKQFDLLTHHEERLQFKYSPDIESDHELFQRISPFIREVALAFPGENVLMVTHGGMMKAFLLAMGFGTYEELQFGAIGNTAYIKVQCDGSELAIAETWGIQKTTLPITSHTSPVSSRT